MLSKTTAAIDESGRTCEAETEIASAVNREGVALCRVDLLSHELVELSDSKRTAATGLRSKKIAK